MLIATHNDIELMVGCPEDENTVVTNEKIIITFFGDTVIKNEERKLIFDALEIAQHLINRNGNKRKKLETELINLTYGLFSTFQEIPCQVTYVVFWRKGKEFHYTIIQIENEEGKTTKLVLSAKCPDYLACNDSNEFTIGHDSMTEQQLRDSFDDEIEIYRLFIDTKEFDPLYGTARPRYYGFYL